MVYCDSEELGRSSATTNGYREWVDCLAPYLHGGITLPPTPPPRGTLTLVGTSPESDVGGEVERLREENAALRAQMAQQRKQAPQETQEREHVIPKREETQVSANPNTKEAEKAIRTESIAKAVDRSLGIPRIHTNTDTP